jgi:hypothetical protein
MTAAQKTAAELLIMNKDALAALVRMGADAGDPVKFISDPTDRFTVYQMLRQNAVEPRTAAGSLD